MVLLFYDVYGIYLMGLVSIGRLEGYEDLGSKSFIKSKNFKLFGGVCFDGVFWLFILLMGI